HRRSHVIEEDEGTDHPVERGREHAPDREAAQVAQPRLDEHAVGRRPRDRHRCRRVAHAFVLAGRASDFFLSAPGGGLSSTSTNAPYRAPIAPPSTNGQSCTLWVSPIMARSKPPHALATMAYSPTPTPNPKMPFRMAVHMVLDLSSMCDQIGRPHRSPTRPPTTPYVIQWKAPPRPR